MAINNAIRLLGFVLLAGLAASSLSAQEMADPTSGGGQNALHSAAAVPPAILAENPPKAPKVTCDDGQLTISANNSTLGSVLAAVHACIGIQIDIPAAGGEARTFEELGPGPERQVLETLLSGTDFNYVIGSSDADPGKVETVLLMERTLETAANAAPTDRSLTAGRRAWMEAFKVSRRAGTTAEETPQAADEPADAPAADEPVAAPAPAENVNAAPASDTPAPAADPSSAPAASPDGVAFTPSGSPAPELSPSVGPVSDTGKSTTERIADMQQMFEQRRQINQSQSSANAQPQP